MAELFCTSKLTEPITAVVGELDPFLTRFEGAPLDAVHDWRLRRYDRIVPDDGLSGVREQRHFPQSLET